MEPRLYHDENAMALDLPRLTLRLDSRERIEVQLLPGDVVRSSSKAVRARITHQNVRYILIAALPSTKTLDVSLESTGGRWRNDWTVSVDNVQPRGMKR